MGSTNELPTEMLGLAALNSFAKHNSAMRSNMFASHFSQRLVIDGAEEKRIQTGVEREFGKYTFSVKMPDNGRIIKIIEKYPKGIDVDSLNFNPETIVIYENDNTKEIDYFSIPYYGSYHQFFGFKYDQKETRDLIKPGAFIPKDTIFADSTSVGENSNYKYGVNANVAFMSIPSVSEDGLMISRDYLEKFKFRVYETRVVEFGAGQFPLNLYGTPQYYKPFPDIGDYIREDGVLMMTRQYDNDLMPVEMSIYDTTEPDFIFDKGVYVRGGKGRVIDIKVISNNNPNRQLPKKMCAHIEKYERAHMKFHREILDTEEQLRRERKKKFADGKLKLSPKLHRLIVESLTIVNHNATKLKQNLNLLYRKAPIDEYRIEFVVEYEIVPKEGFKLTDCHGGKCTICKIEEPENMPVDHKGNRADIVMDAASTISRMNIGRLYEHYICAAARDVTTVVVNNVKANRAYEAYEHLLGFYKIVSEKQYNFFSALNEQERFQHLEDIVKDGVYVFYPIDNEKDSIQVIQELEKHYTPTYGPVSYVGDSGQRVMTKNNIRIAPLYIMLLDKIADDWSSVSSGKLQHFGVLSPMTKSEKFSYPFRNSPVRTIGETEGRIVAGYCGRETIAESMDRSNSPMTQRNIVRNILQAPKPCNIDHVVDRDRVALGSSRPLQLISHVMICGGFKPIYRPEGK